MSEETAHLVAVTSLTDFTMRYVAVMNLVHDKTGTLVVVISLTTATPKDVAIIWLVHEVAVHPGALAGFATIMEATDIVMVQEENKVL